MMNMVIILATGFILYFLFSLFWISAGRSQKPVGNRGRVVVTSLEFVLWVLYFFWVVEQLFEDKSYYVYLFPALVFVFVIFVAWFYFKDLIAGALFKIQHNPKQGHYFEMEQWKGSIKEIKATHLLLETSAGEEVKIPYARIQGNIISQHGRKGKAGDLKIKIKLREVLPAEEAINRIKWYVLVSPFCAFKKRVSVRLSNEEENVYEIVFAATSAEFAGKVEAHLRQHLA